jgi:putative ABC transport system permease protein
VLGGALKTSLMGIAIGAVAAFLATRLMAEMLYGVSAADPITFLSVAVLLVLVTAIASYVPARRATTVDPVIALRYE